MTNSNDCLDCNEIDRVSNMIAVSKEEIVGFIQEVREKQRQKEEQKLLLEKYRNKSINKLTIPDLKKVLSKLGIKVHSGQKLKLDFLKAVDDEFMKRNFSDDDVEKFLFYEEKIN